MTAQAIVFAVENYSPVSGSGPIAESSNRT
jgi:hypothetical protein